MKKVTMNTFKKMSREDLLKAIDKARHQETIWTGASKQELINIAVGLYNKGLLKFE